MKQTTLAMVWGGKSGIAKTTGQALSSSSSSHLAEGSSATGQHSVSTASATPTDISELDFRANPRLPLAAKLSKHDAATLEGFDSCGEGTTWVYPVNYPVREYQFNIVASALAKNTLVCLPTGLGKTFIAAVVMMNFYRWYPNGRVVFMAPTKPLVAQQIEACYGIAGVPAGDTIEMTGCMPPATRRAAWRDKRLFFCTPQVFANDLINRLCDATQIRCVVIDEAHKATGNHAYCVAVRTLIARQHHQFRVLALSATPGSDVRSIQEVINNLLISHIELRTEQCRDIQRYSHERSVEKIVVPLGPEVEAAVRKLEAILDVYVSKLKQNKAVYANVRVSTLSKYALIMQRQEYFQRYGNTLPQDRQSFIHRTFAMAISLYHGYEIVQQHGLRPLYNFLKGVLEGERGSNSTRLELQRQPAFTELWDSLLDKFKPDPNSTLSSTQSVFVGGHPKLNRLLDIVLNHFQSAEDPEERQRTRVIIFSQYRDSVTEIARMLKQHRPLVRCMTFFGQATTGKASKGFTQRDQLRVMQEFRQGAYNTLVSTCVGEEGLDIGQVDLIICYDAQKSPVRLIQRMGRTGRARQGRIVMLLSAGKEEANYSASLSKRSSVNKIILDGYKKLQFYPDPPRMIPTGLQPTLSLRRLDIQQKPASAAKKRRTTVGAAAASSSGTPAKLLPNQVFEYESRLASTAPAFVRLRPSRLFSLPASVAEIENCSLGEAGTWRSSLTNHCSFEQWRRPTRCASSGPAGGASVTRHHLVALGRLIDCHRAGATSLVFHAIGLRDMADASLAAVATQTARLLTADDVDSDNDNDDDIFDVDVNKLDADDGLASGRKSDSVLLMPPPPPPPPQRHPTSCLKARLQPAAAAAAAAISSQSLFHSASAVKLDAADGHSTEPEAPISPVFSSSTAVRQHRISSQLPTSSASSEVQASLATLSEATASRRPLFSLRPFESCSKSDVEALQSAIRCLLQADDGENDAMAKDVVDQLAVEWSAQRSRLLPPTLKGRRVSDDKPADPGCIVDCLQLLDGVKNWAVDDFFTGCVAGDNSLNASSESEAASNSKSDDVVMASQRPGFKFASVFQNVPLRLPASSTASATKRRVSFADNALNKDSEDKDLNGRLQGPTAVKDSSDHCDNAEHGIVEEKVQAFNNSGSVSKTAASTPVSRRTSLTVPAATKDSSAEKHDKDYSEAHAVPEISFSKSSACYADSPVFSRRAVAENKDPPVLSRANARLEDSPVFSSRESPLVLSSAAPVNKDNQVSSSLTTGNIKGTRVLSGSASCNKDTPLTVLNRAAPVPKSTPVLLNPTAAETKDKGTPDLSTPAAGNKDWSKVDDSSRRGRLFAAIFEQIPIATPVAPTPFLRRLSAWSNSRQKQRRSGAASACADVSRPLDFSAALRLLEDPSANAQFHLESDIFRPLSPPATAADPDASPVFDKLNSTSQRPKLPNRSTSKLGDDDDEPILLDTSWLTELAEAPPRQATPPTPSQRLRQATCPNAADAFVKPQQPPATPTRPAGPSARAVSQSVSRPLKRKSSSPPPAASNSLLNSSASSSLSPAFVSKQKKKKTTAAAVAKNNQSSASLCRSQARSLSLAAALPKPSKQPTHPRESDASRQKRRRKPGGGRQFLDEEAALTDSDADFVSSDESDADSDADDGSSFVDDATQQETDTTALAAVGGMHGVYLRSLAGAQRSPARRFKIPSLADRPFNPAEIYSQLPGAAEEFDSPESEYQFDSFLVPNEQTISPAAARHLSPLSAALAARKRRAKQAGDSRQKLSKQLKKPQRRLVVIQEDTQFCANDGDSSDEFL